MEDCTVEVLPGSRRVMRIHGAYGWVRVTEVTSSVIMLDLFPKGSRSCNEIINRSYQDVASNPCYFLYALLVLGEL